MPQLEAAEFARVAAIIDELQPVVEDLNEVPRNFVSDMIEKKALYGERMFISPKQVAWLERLHEENVGTAVHADDKEAEGPDEGDPRFNDEIPF